MLNALAFGLGVGAAIQAWRGWPPASVVTADSLALVFCIGLVCAWLGGRSRRGASAVAVASAEATATAVNSVNVAVFTTPPDSAGHHSAGGVRVPSEAAPWMVAREGRSGLEHLETDEILSILEVDRETQYDDGS